MNTTDWIRGKLNKKEDGYYIDNEWILWDWEDGVLQKGVEWLCKKYKFESVLELGFGVGWTATEFQKQGIKKHVILEPNKEVYKNALKWNKNHNAEIINIFSWEYETKEKFDLIYDDIVYVGGQINYNKHKNFIKTFKNQSYAKCAVPALSDPQYDYIDFKINNKLYRQTLLQTHEII
tara:strand:- start:1578 stop:2111 length:534 start_codon:yes stop_codon:yes gene_type:complete